MGALGKLVVALGLDTKELDEGARALSSKFANLATSLQNAMLPLAGALGGVALATYKATEAAVDYSKSINMMSTRTGLAGDYLEEMRYVAQQLDFDMQALEGTVSAFTMRLQEINKGTGSASEALRKLQISVKDGNGQFRQMSELFPEIIQRLSEMTNVQERNSLATEIFGRQARELFPLLNAGGKTIEELRERARSLGLVMGGDARNQLDAFGNRMKELTMRLEMARNKMVLELLPAMQKQFIPILEEGVIPAIKLAVDWFGRFSIAMGFVATVLKNTIEGRGGIIFTPSWWKMVGNTWDDAIKILQKFTQIDTPPPGSGKGPAGLTDGFRALNTELGKLPTIGAGMLEGLQTLGMRTYSPVWLKFAEDAQKAAKKLNDTMQPALVKIGETVDWMNVKFDALTESVFEVSDAMVQAAVDGAESMRDVARAAVEAGRRIIASYIAEGIAAAIRNALINAGPFGIFLAGAAGAAAAALFNRLVPKLAQGGLAFGPTLALVGDNPRAAVDPEVIAPLSMIQEMGGRRLDVYVHGTIDGRSIKFVLDRVEEDLIRISA
jgi:methyl-accepting chemotaxis protein